MSAAVKDEPSMEEILASIRRIISEQDAPAASVAAKPAGDAYARAVEATDDVLELTTVVNDDGTLSEIGQADFLADEEMPASMDGHDALDAADSFTQTDAFAAQDIIEQEAVFTDSAAADAAVNADAAAHDVFAEALDVGRGYDEDIAPIAATAFAAFEESIDDNEPDAESIAFAADTSIAAQDDMVSSFAVPDAVDTSRATHAIQEDEDSDDMALLSPAAIAASVQSLAELQRAQERQAQQSAFLADAPRIDSSASSPTLEDLTRSMLKPLLQEWLNSNLPDIVERIVREEVERLVKKA